MVFFLVAMLMLIFWLGTGCRSGVFVMLSRRCASFECKVCEHATIVRLSTTGRFGSWLVLAPGTWLRLARLARGCAWLVVSTCLVAGPRWWLVLAAPVDYYRTSPGTWLVLARGWACARVGPGSWQALAPGSSSLLAGPPGWPWRLAGSACWLVLAPGWTWLLAGPCSWLLAGNALLGT